MAETNVRDSILLNTANRLFGELSTDESLRCAEQGEWLGAAWAAVEELGLPLALTSESAGGFGVDSAEALELIRLTGLYALPLPLAETLLANRWLGNAGLAVGEGVSTIAPGTLSGELRLERKHGVWHVSGVCRRVPWARRAARVAAVAAIDERCYLVSLTPDLFTLQSGENIAGMPRDTLTVAGTLKEDAVAELDQSQLAFLAEAASVRVMAISGALEGVLDLTVGYSAERVQFGRPIAKFQVIQQGLALLAGQVSAAQAAADISKQAMTGGNGVLAAAIAKVRAGETVSMAASIAHQTHGAIGFTSEHRLHFLTKLLWSYRDEFGSESFWSQELGRQVCAEGADALWPLVTSL